MDKKNQGNPLEGVELLLDRVIVEIIKPGDEERESGFTVPEAARMQNINLPKYGHIVACGPGVPEKGEMKVKVGDKVCYMFYSGTPLMMGKRQFLIMREFDIAFVIKK